jgi:hypothetical protein
MIDDGDIVARIDTQKGMVRFLEDPEQYRSAAMVERIHGQIAQSVKLAKKLQRVNHAASCDQHYLSKVRQLPPCAAVGRRWQVEDRAGLLLRCNVVHHAFVCQGAVGFKLFHVAGTSLLA